MQNAFFSRMNISKELDRATKRRIVHQVREGKISLTEGLKQWTKYCIEEIESGREVDGMQIWSW